MRKCSNFIIYMKLPSFLRATYWRHCLFSVVHYCLLCQRLIDCSCVGLFLGSQFYSVDLCIPHSPTPNTMLFCQYHVANTLTIVCNIVWNQRVWYLQHCSFFLGITLAIRGLVWFHLILEKHLFISVKNVLGVLIKIALSL